MCDSIYNAHQKHEVSQPLIATVIYMFYDIKEVASCMKGGQCTLQNKPGDNTASYEAGQTDWMDTSCANFFLREGIQHGKMDTYCSKQDILDTDVFGLI